MSGRGKKNPFQSRISTEQALSSMREMGFKVGTSRQFTERKHGSSVWDRY